MQTLLSEQYFNSDNFSRFMVAVRSIVWMHRVQIAPQIFNDYYCLKANLIDECIV